MLFHFPKKTSFKQFTYSTLIKFVKYYILRAFYLSILLCLHLGAGHWGRVYIIGIIWVRGYSETLID